jgi:hypothetical protein
MRNLALVGRYAHDVAVGSHADRKQAAIRVRKRADVSR